MATRVCIISQSDHYIDAPGTSYLDELARFEGGGTSNSYEVDLFCWDRLWARYEMAQECARNNSVYIISPPLALLASGEGHFYPNDDWEYNQEYSERMVWHILRGLRERQVTILVLWPVDSGVGMWGNPATLERRMQILIDEIMAADSGKGRLKIIATGTALQENLPIMDVQALRWVSRHGRLTFRVESCDKGVNYELIGRLSKKGPASAIRVQVGKARMFILPFRTCSDGTDPYSENPWLDFLQLMAIAGGGPLPQKKTAPKRNSGGRSASRPRVASTSGRKRSSAAPRTVANGWCVPGIPPRLRRLAMALEGKGTVKAKDLMKKCKNEPLAHIVKRFKDHPRWGPWLERHIERPRRGYYRLIP